MFVHIQRENIRLSKKEVNKAVTMITRAHSPKSKLPVRLWITTSPYRRPVGSLPSTCMLCTPPPPPTHCTKVVYTTQGSTRDLWTVVYVRISFQACIMSQGSWVWKWFMSQCECIGRSLLIEITFPWRRMGSRPEGLSWCRVPLLSCQAQECG
jgi:hypothetical protein